MVSVAAAVYRAQTNTAAAVNTPNLLTTEQVDGGGCGNRYCRDYPPPPSGVLTRAKSRVEEGRPAVGETDGRRRKNVHAGSAHICSGARPAALRLPHATNPGRFYRWELGELSDWLTGLGDAASGAVCATVRRDSCVAFPTISFLGSVSF